MTAKVIPMPDPCVLCGKCRPGPGTGKEHVCWQCVFGKKAA